MSASAGPAQLAERLVAFAAALRGRGVMVAPEQVADALGARVA